MHIIEAKITGQPRNVTTKHGEKAVVDARAANGENLTIWRPANDPAVMRLANGERVQLGIDSKGKVSLVETAFDRAESDRPEISPTVNESSARPMGFSVTAPFEAEQKLRQQLAAASPAESGRSAEIAEYVGKLGKLYSHCYKTASQELENQPLGTPEVKDVATTLFIQAVRHFNL